MKWTNEIDSSFKQMRKQRSGLLEFIYPKFKELNLFKKNISVLSIGAGSGELELEIVKDWNASIGYIDPSEHGYQCFQQSVKEQKLQLQVQEAFHGTFEDFQSDFRYDLIISVQAWHYIGFDSVLLDKALALLTSNGKLVIALTSETAFSHELKNLLHPQDHEFINFEELSRFATTLNYPQQSIYAQKIIPLTRFIENDDFTEYGKNWMSVMGRKPWEQIPAEIKTKAKQIILDFSQNNQLDDGWGVVIF